MESQEAEFAALKCDVMTGWDEAMRVPSKAAMNWEMRIWAKMSQKRAGQVSPRKMKDFAVEVAEAVLLRRRRGERSVRGFVLLLLDLMWLLLLLRLLWVVRTPSSSSIRRLILVSVSESGPDST